MPFHGTITETYTPGGALHNAPAVAAGVVAFLMGWVYRAKTRAAHKVW